MLTAMVVVVVVIDAVVVVVVVVKIALKRCLVGRVLALFCQHLTRTHRP